MSDEPCPPVVVTRRIETPAHVIFGILTDPARHPELDGSGMVRQAVTAERIKAAGDVFVVSMASRKKGSYQIRNHVMEFEPDRRLAWEPHAGSGLPEAGAPPLGHRWTYLLEPDGEVATTVTEIYDCSRVPADVRQEMANGELWRPAMEATLERLAEIAATVSNA